MPGTVCIISPGDPASNPRLLKQADALHGAGQTVTAVVCDYTRQLRDIDHEIAAPAPWKVVRVPRPLGERAVAMGAKRLACLLEGAGGRPPAAIAARASGGPARTLRRAALEVSADIYIGHYAAGLVSLARDLGIGDRVMVLPKAPPDQMAILAACYDIGLSLESDTPENWRLCLSNKMIRLPAGRAAATRSSRRFASRPEHRPKRSASSGALPPQLAYREEHVARICRRSLCLGQTEAGVATPNQPLRKGGPWRPVFLSTPRAVRRRANDRRNALTVDWRDRQHRRSSSLQVEARR